MEFPKIENLTTAVKARLTDLTDLTDLSVKIFKDVRVSAITSYDNLFELLPDITMFPAAIIAVGEIDYKDMMVSRDLQLSVIVIDEFRVDFEQTNSTYQLIDRVSEALTSEVVGLALKIDKFNLMAESFSPLELDAMHTAWQFNLKATSSF